MMLGTQTWGSRGVGWGGRWEEGSEAVSLKVASFVSPWGQQNSCKKLIIGLALPNLVFPYFPNHIFGISILFGKTMTGKVTMMVSIISPAFPFVHVSLHHWCCIHFFWYLEYALLLSSLPKAFSQRRVQSLLSGPLGSHTPIHPEESLPNSPLLLVYIGCLLCVWRILIFPLNIPHSFVIVCGHVCIL